MQVGPLGWEDPLEKGMATHSSILAWRIPWTGSPAGYRPWGRRESDLTEVTARMHAPDEAHRLAPSLASMKLDASSILKA